MKPDIVFFGEGLPDAFHIGMVEDKTKCDLLIVIGSSLKVRPVGLIPSSIPCDVPQILINREPLDHLSFDVELLGDSDVIINQLCHMLGDDWNEVCWQPNSLNLAPHLLPPAINLWQSNTHETTQHSIDTKEVSTDSQDSINVSEEHNSSALTDIYLSPFQDGQLDNSVSMPMSVESIGDSGFCMSDGTSSPKLEPSDCNMDQGVDETVKNNMMSVDDNQMVSNSDTCTMQLVQDDIESLQMPSASDTHKERHMSIDSARDSGIGDGSNSVDSTSMNPRLVHENIINKPKDQNARPSLADLLPFGTYYFESPSRYIFPGAEVFCDDWDTDADADSDSSTSDSESESASVSNSPHLSDDSSSEDTDWVEPPPKKMKQINADNTPELLE